MSDTADALTAAKKSRRGVGAAMTEVQSAIDAGTDPVAAIARLTEAWANHVAVTEGDDGLLADVVEEAPNLAHRVETLRTEHAEILELLRACASPGTAGAPHRPAIDALLAAIDRHRHRGAEVVYDAFNVDIATAD
jgi:hypothetical protein